MFRSFERLVDPYAAEQGPDAPPRRLWPFLRAEMAPFRWVFATTGAISILVAAGDVALIWYVGRLVDLMTAGDPAAVIAAHWVEFLTIALIVAVVRPVVSGIGSALLHSTIMPNFTTAIRWRAHRHVLRQPVGWFEGDFAGRLASRVMQTPTSAADAVFQTFDAMAFGLVTILGAVVLLTDADPRLVLPLLLWCAAYAWLVRWTLRNAGPAAKATADARSALSGRIVDSYTNIHAVKLFAHHATELAHAREAMELARNRHHREMRVLVTMDLALTVLNGLLIVAVIGWAGVLWYQGQTTVGAVAAAGALVLRLNNLTYWLMWATTSLVQALGVVAEGMDTIAQPLSQQDRPDARPLQLREGRIEFREVSHHYGKGAGGLDRVTLTVAAGERVGIVGRSGAGKSTLVKLLLRFYEPEAGQILIDGQDIAMVTEESLRAAIGMVQQDTALLHRSVRENILYGSPNATDAEMIEAARQADAEGFIRTLADPQGRHGYDAQVGERGVKLSGGQRQRIAIARVILKDAPVLVLDEATSALDSEAEASIQEALYGVMAGKTVIAIAHRLSTLAHMDRILVLEDGRVAEEGTHAALLAQGGLYAQFWARQSGGFIGTEAAE